MSNLQRLRATFDSFDDLVETIGPGLSRTHLFAPTDEEIPPGTRVRLEIGTVRKGALIRGVGKVAGPGDEASGPGLHLHIIHLDPSSTRLVDSIVRGEIAAVGIHEPSVPSPFDIPPAEPEAVPEPEPDLAVEPEPPEEPEPPPPPTRSRFGSLAWPLGIAILAGVFLLIFDLASRDGESPLLTGRDRQTVSEAPTPPAPAAPPTEAPPPASEPEAAEAVDHEAATEQVERVLLAWADAWSRQDPDSYLELYGPEYSPPGLDRDAWQRQRRARITAPESIEVTVSELDVELAGTERAIARFHQLYATGDKALSARKTLEIERLTAGWKIVAERVETKEKP